ncbi:MAG TPA: S9 family peptidase [Caulobacteraceae bacterium]|jgi:acetyl esterase/lipase
MRSFVCLALTLAAAFAVAWPTRAAAPLAAYGALPMIEEIAISPSGRLLAIAMVKDEQRTIVIEDLGLKKPVNGVRLGDVKLRGLEWAGDNHVIFLTSFTGGAVDFATDTREWFVATDFNLATHKLAPLLADANLALNTVEGMPSVRMVDGKPYAMAEGVYFGGRVDEGAGMTVRHSELAMYKVALDGDRSSLLADDGTTVTGYVLGADGQPAAESLYDDVAKHWTLKVWRDHQWREVLTKPAAIEQPELLGLGRDGSSIVVSGLRDKVNELREVSPDGATVSDPLPGPQTGSLIHDPASHRLIGIVNFDGEALDYHFYDSADAAQWAGIEAAFRGQRAELVSSSDDRQRLVVHLDSRDLGPGYALVDLATHSSQWLGGEYPGLSAADISQVQTVGFKAADGLELSGYLTLPNGRAAKNLPLVVFPHGGPAARDEPGFDWWAQAMASRGYAVLQVNYRGSSGFGRSFLEAGFGEWGRKMQTDLSDGVRYLASQGTIDPKRVCIVGASYGGYAALAGATLDPGVYRCAVDVSGPAELARFVGSGKSGEALAGERYWLRYMGVSAISDPRLAAISPADLAGKVSIPILIIHGKDDTVVPFAQSQMMADALAHAGKPYQLVVLNHEDHWLSRGDTRLQMLQATMDFLQKNNPAD